VDNAPDRHDRQRTSATPLEVSPKPLFNSGTAFNVYMQP
jgi:hypothetical protein